MIHQLEVNPHNRKRAIPKWGRYCQKVKVPKRKPKDEATFAADSSLASVVFICSFTSFKLFVGFASNVIHTAEGMVQTFPNYIIDFFIVGSFVNDPQI